MDIVNKAKKHLEDSQCGANPRNRLYMDSEAIRVMGALVDEVERLRNKYEH